MFRSRFALHLDGSWASADYKAKIATTDSVWNPTGTTSVNGTLDTTTVALNPSCYFLDGPLTPFLMGGRLDLGFIF